MQASLGSFPLKKNKNQQGVSCPVIFFGFGFKKHKSTERDHWMPLPPPSAGSMWISIKEATESFFSCGKKLWTGESCPGWLHLIPVLSPTVSCQITPTFLPIISPGGGDEAGGAERERKASRNTDTMLREKVPLATTFENSINNHSKCNNARTPGTQARPSGVTSDRGLAGQRRE